MGWVATRQGFILLFHTTVVGTPLTGLDCTGGSISIIFSSFLNSIMEGFEGSTE